MKSLLRQGGVLLSSNLRLDQSGWNSIQPRGAYFLQLQDEKEWLTVKINADLAISLRL